MIKTRPILICLGITLFVNVLAAQKLMLGEKAPDLKVKEWIAEPYNGNNPRLIEFMNIGNSAHFAELNRIAEVFGSQMDVVAIVNGHKNKILAELPQECKFHVAVDDGGKLTTSYGVQFVPYCVITEGKGKVLWFGNPSQLDDTMIYKLLKQK